MKRITLAGLVILTGCAASTGVMLIGKDMYMVSHRDNGPASSLGALKAAAYRDATQFCASQNKALQVIRSNDIPRSLGQFPETEVQFTCINVNNSDASLETK